MISPYLIIIIVLSSAILIYATYFIFRVYIVPFLAKKGLFFGAPLARAIRYVYNMDKFADYLYDEDEFKIDLATGNIEENNFAPGKSNQSWSMRHFGAKWIGIPPCHVHTWNQVWSRPRKSDDKEIQGKVTLVENSPVTHRAEIVDALYLNLPLADVFPVELGDRSDVIITITWTARCRNARIPINDLHGDWFLNMYAVIDNVLEQFAKDYTNSNWKSGRGGIDANGKSMGQTLDLLKAIFTTKEFEAQMLRTTGFNTCDFLFESSDPTSKMVAEANQELAIKTAEAAAKVAEAEGYAKQLGIRTEADANRIKQLGEASGNAIQYELAGSGSAQTLVEIRRARALGRLRELHSLVQTTGGGTPSIILDTRDTKTGSNQPTPSHSKNPPPPTQNSARPGPR